MSNHWHMVLSPQVDGAMSAFIGWITLTHTQRKMVRTHWANCAQSQRPNLTRSAPPALQSTYWFRAVAYFGRVLLSALELRKKVNYRSGKFEMPRRIQCGGTQDQRADQASIFADPNHQMRAKRNLERPAYQEARRTRQWPIRRRSGRCRLSVETQDSYRRSSCVGAGDLSARARVSE